MGPERPTGDAPPGDAPRRARTRHRGGPQAPRGRTGSSASAGFTLLEIIIVLVIVAMAATLVAPAIEGGMRARAVRSAARSVAGKLRALQAEAVRTGQVQRVYVDPVSNSLLLENRPSLELGDVARIAEVRGGEWLSGGYRVQFYPNGANTGIDILVSEQGAPPADGFVVHLDPLIGLVAVRDPRR